MVNHGTHSIVILSQGNMARFTENCRKLKHTIIKKQVKEKY